MSRYSDDFFRTPCWLKLSGNDNGVLTIICEGECYWDGSSQGYQDPLSLTQIQDAFDEALEEHDEYKRIKNERA